MTRMMRAVLTALLVGATVVAVPGAVDAQNGRRLDVGVSGGDPARVAQIEGAIGQGLDVVRIFKRLDDRFPNASEQRLLDSGHDLWISIDSSTRAGRVRWRDLANAAPGSALHGHLTRWGDSIEPYEDRVHLTFQHEPESRINVALGDADDFIAAWRQVMTVMAERGAQPNRAWTMTSYSFRVDQNDRRTAGRWYPGDGWVDAFGAAAYNWAGCRPGFNDPWRSAAEALEPFRRFGARYPGMELMISELGSAEAGAGRKARWIRETADLLVSPGYEQFSTVIWFNSVHDQRDGQNSCNWRLDSSPSVMPAFGDMVRTLHGRPPAAAVVAPPVTTTTTRPAPTTTSTTRPAPTTTNPRVPTTAAPTTAAPTTTTTVAPTTAAPTTAAPTTTRPAPTTSTTRRQTTTSAAPAAPVAAAPARSAGSLLLSDRLDRSGDRIEIELTADTTGLHRLDLLTGGSLDAGASVRGSFGHFVAATAPGDSSIMVPLEAGVTRRLAVWSRSGSGSIDVRLASPADQTTIRSGRADASGTNGAVSQTMRWTADRSGPTRFVLDWSTTADLHLRVTAPDGTVIGEDRSGNDLALVEADLVAGRRYTVEIWATAGASSFQLSVADN